MPATKTRTCRLTQLDSSLWMLDMVIGEDCFAYRLKKLPVSGGHGYRLEKGITLECYEVFLSGSRHLHDSCSCKGWQRWAKCKHTSALRALVAAGKLPRPQIEPAAQLADF